MEGNPLDSKNQVEVVEDLSTRVSNFSLNDPISNSSSPLDNEVAGNRRDHVEKEYCDSFSVACIEGNSMNSSRLYPEIPEETLDRNKEDTGPSGDLRKRGKYFYYDSSLYEDTGVWIPVSVPPMLEDDQKEWAKGFHTNGGYFPEDDMGWNQYLGEEKELTMWDVLVEMLLVARGKVTYFASRDIHKCTFSWISSHVLEQAWREMAQTLREANFGNVKELLEAETPKWLADSAAASCMLCGVRFHPIMCTRHHCRFCGGIFCGECSKGRSLLPSKFRVSDPQRVCDVCCVRLESVQPYLMNHVSNAAQLPIRDLTDLSTLRSWVNFPWALSMEYEIYKATNTIKGYNLVWVQNFAFSNLLMRKLKLPVETMHVHDNYYGVVSIMNMFQC